MMKSMPILAIAFGACVMTQAYSAEVFTVLDTKEKSVESLTPGGDSWGTDQSNNANDARQLVGFHRNADNSVTRTPYPESYIPNLKPKGSASTHALNAASGSIEQVWPLPDGNVLFATDVYPGGNSYLYKFNAKTGTVGNNAPDYNNKQASMNIGERDDIPQGDIRALDHRSLLAATLPGQGNVLFFGEYNVSKGDADWVALWKSNDMGDTWSKVIEWNTQGHQTRHILGIVQNPYNNWIYILFGDDDTESAIVAWDGVSAPPPDNTPLNKMGAYPGWKSVAGTTRVRTGDLIFTPPPDGKCVWLPMMDSLKTGQSLYGQRANYDLTGLEATSKIPYDDGVSPIIGARSNTGSIYWTSYRNDTAAEKKIDIWKTIDSGLNWMRISKVDVFTDWTVVPQNIHVNGSIMESVSTDFLDINGRDLEFVVGGGKVGSTGSFSSQTSYPKGAASTNPDTIVTKQNQTNEFDVAQNDLGISSNQIVIKSQPKHGSVTISCCGRVKFIPNAGFAGEDSFSYALKNASGALTNVSTVNIYVLKAFNDSFNVIANTAQVQKVTVTENSSVGKNDLPAMAIGGRKFGILSDIKRVSGSGKGAISLKFNQNTGALSYTLTAPTTAVTDAQKQAAKRGVYKFNYTMAINGLKMPATAAITVK